MRIYHVHGTISICLVNCMKCFLSATPCNGSDATATDTDTQLSCIVKVWDYHNNSPCSFIIIGLLFYMLCLCTEHRASLTNIHSIVPLILFIIGTEALLVQPAEAEDGDSKNQRSFVFVALHSDIVSCFACWLSVARA